METNFSENEPFIVKNSIGIMVFIAIASLVMFFSSIAYNDMTVSLPLLIPAIPCIAGIFIRNPLIEVNSTGIYTKGSLITDWAHFANADFTQRTKAGRWTDNFVLILEYSKEGYYGYFKCELPLSNTQNKSEEAVLAAIDFFYTAYRKKLASGEHAA